MDIFSYAEGRKERDKGIEIASSGYGADEWIQEARDFALMFAMKYGEVTINDVNKKCPRPNNISPNAAGSIFKDKRFKKVGFKQSEKVSSHARVVSVWALNEKWS